MKNLRIKSLVLLILILTILNSLAWYENAKTIDIAVTKNMHYQRITINRIFAIENLQERKAETEKFIVRNEKSHIEEQNKRVNIFTFLSISIFLLLVLLLISYFEFRRKNKNVF